MRHRDIFIAVLLSLAGFSTAARAQDSLLAPLSLNAMVGGGLPYSVDGGGYLVTRLMTQDGQARRIGVMRQAPFGFETSGVFDTRPVVGLGGRYELGKSSAGAKLSLRALLSAGMERQGEGERALLGLAGLSLVF